MATVILILCIAGCYLVGSIPIAYLLVKAVRKIDIRTVGSGNSGATNAGRLLGGWGFGLVLALDALKGFIPIELLYIFCERYFHSGHHIAVLLGAAALIVGHAFPIYLGFKGGKGVAPSLGVFTALAPYSILVALGIFITVTVLSRMISAGSILAAAAMAITTTIFQLYLLEQPWIELVVFTWVACIFVIYGHRANIRRILSGTENRIKVPK